MPVPACVARELVGGASRRRRSPSRVVGQDRDDQRNHGLVAELDDRIAMLEPKARNQMEDPEVLAKRAAAVTWCQLATDHAATHDGKPWTYALIPHDAIAENWTLADLIRRWTVNP